MIVNFLDYDYITMEHYQIKTTSSEKEVVARMKDIKKIVQHFKNEGLEIKAEYIDEKIELYKTLLAIIGHKVEFIKLNIDENDDAF